MQRKSKATIAGAIGLALALVGQTPAPATSTPPGWTIATSTLITQQLTSTAAVKPLVGDFSGNGRDDVFFYAPGTAADYLWRGRGYSTGGSLSGRFTVSSLPVSGSYNPVVGDFDGNGSDDIFWYAPGTPADSIWYFEAGVIASSVSYNVVGTYTPVVANFDSVDADDSNQKDDIFFYSSGGASSLWSGNTNRTFSSRSYPTQAPKGAKVLVGNFYEDGHTDGTYHPDLLFYTAGTGADAFWVSDHDGSFGIVPKTISGSYIPVVGNFDSKATYPESSLSDILWYAPGKGADSVWMNNGESFTSSPLTVNATTYKPYVVPKILGADAIMWNNTAGQDYQWQPNGVEGFSFVSTNLPEMGARTPIVGNFDDRLPRVSSTISWGADVLWAQAGDLAAQKEYFWAGDDPGKWVLPLS